MATDQMLATATMPLGFLLTPVLNEHVFGPLVSGNLLCRTALGEGPNRGMGLLMITGGLLLSCWGVLGLRDRPLRRIEDRLPDIPTGSVISEDLDVLQGQADALQDEAETAVLSPAAGGRSTALTASTTGAHPSRTKRWAPGSSEQRRRAARIRKADRPHVGIVSSGGPAEPRIGREEGHANAFRRTVFWHVGSTPSRNPGSDGVTVPWAHSGKIH
ncbi:hypothetical protein ACIP98_34280 [Streptomyces sp. NPDC088354]|uniref:hypothetical protein n=1 Tax=Streptomyces sp. NPDC088354 TaxID=3365856 RepID=UPI00380CBCDB